MPRVKIDYVVSFSSEDPDNPASNLLAWDVSKKRWLCAKGEPSCSVVLQLPRAVKISAVQIGAHNAALVEVLVGRSEKPNEPFQVLVPSCVFLSPAESRKAEGAARVRSVGAEGLAAAAAQRWDRVRVVCSQPYNKHCKYGLNFVHITESEGAPTPAPLPTSAAPPTPAATPTPAVTPTPAALWREAGSSSDDEFHPGELFAKHKSPTAVDTGAQIRRASSQALRNISDSATKLVKAPHAKMDLIVQRHKDEKSRDEAKKPTEKKRDRKTSNDTRDKKEDSHKTNQRDNKDRNERTPTDDRKNRSDPVNKESKDEPSASSSRENNDKDRKRSRDERHPKRVGGDFNSILKGVVFVMSGYVNPQRAIVRDKAVEMGARYERDWGPHCTHLICAFPDTPKLRQVRAAAGGAAVPVARAEWLRESHRLRRRLPWRPYATEPEHLRPPRPPDTDDGHGDDAAHGDECDTDDEIEKALRKQKKRRTEDSPSTSKDKNDQNEGSKRAKYDANVTNNSQSRNANVGNTSRNQDANVSNTSRDQDANVSNTLRDQDVNVSNTSDVMFVRDERIQGNVTLDDSDDEKTDEEDRGSEAARERIAASAVLPDLFAGRTFVLAASAARAFDAALLARYARAYGGLVLDAAELDADSTVDYVLSAEADGARVGSADGARVGSAGGARVGSAGGARVGSAGGARVGSAGGARVGSAGGARGARVVRPDWLWRCHAARRRLPLRDHLLA